MLKIENPKQNKKSLAGRELWFPYYAGFSTSFTTKILGSAGLRGDEIVLDPWNGAGTTTAVAKEIGLNSLGIDLNPAMIVAAKARSMCTRQKNSLVPIGKDILAKVASSTLSLDKNDPLLAWYTPASANIIRRFDFSIRNLFLQDHCQNLLTNTECINRMSDIAAFYYTVLFRVVRELVNPFISSNPTWIKKPKNPRNKIRPSAEKISTIFLRNIEEMAISLESQNTLNECLEGTVNIEVGNSEKLRFSDRSIDFILSSPPYCTRIDYAVATMPELALLGYEIDGEFKQLRKELLGSSTVPKNIPEPRDEWGETCLRFLDNVFSHKTKASDTYYYKNHIQYYDGIYKSLLEISRVLKVNGRCVLVLQDSYYKDVHNDLAQMFSEMFMTLGLYEIKRVDFGIRNSMAGKHSHVRKYRSNFRATESVLCFSK